MKGPSLALLEIKTPWLIQYQLEKGKVKVEGTKVYCQILGVVTLVKGPSARGARLYHTACRKQPLEGNTK